MHKYGESKTTRIMMATVPHVTSGSGLRKFQADGFFFVRVYSLVLKSYFSLGRTDRQTYRKHLPVQSATC